MSRLNLPDIVNTAERVRRVEMLVQARCRRQTRDGVAIQIGWLRGWKARQWQQHLKITRLEAIAIGEMLQAYCLAEEEDDGAHIHDASCAFEEAASSLYLSQAA